MSSHTAHPSEATAPASCSLPLRAGQCLQIHWPAGTQLHVRSGQLSLQEPPLWLAGQVWQASHQLCSGQCHVLGHGGWVSLLARRDAVLLVQPPPRGGLWFVWRGVRSLTQRLWAAGRGA